MNNCYHGSGESSGGEDEVYKLVEVLPKPGKDVAGQSQKEVASLEVLWEGEGRGRGGGGGRNREGREGEGEGGEEEESEGGGEGRKKREGESEVGGKEGGEGGEREGWGWGVRGGRREVRVRGREGNVRGRQTFGKRSKENLYCNGVLTKFSAVKCFHRPPYVSLPGGIRSCFSLMLARTLSMSRRK